MPQEAGKQPRPRTLALVRDVRRGEALLMLEGACRHAGELLSARTVRDLSDVETAYGKCGCGVWVVRTTWFGRRDAECFETRMLSPREVEVLIPTGQDR